MSGFRDRLRRGGSRPMSVASAVASPAPRTVATLFRRFWCATWLGHRPYHWGRSPGDFQRGFNECRCGKVRQVPAEIRWDTRHPWDRLPA